MHMRSVSRVSPSGGSHPWLWDSSGVCPPHLSAKSPQLSHPLAWGMPLPPPPPSSNPGCPPSICHHQQIQNMRLVTRALIWPHHFTCSRCANQSSQPSLFYFLMVLKLCPPHLSHSLFIDHPTGMPPFVFMVRGDVSLPPPHLPLLNSHLCLILWEGGYEGWGAFK